MKIYIVNIKIINLQNLTKILQVKKMYVIGVDEMDIIVMIVMHLNILMVNT
jgi:hypothetical protein